MCCCLGQRHWCHQPAVFTAAPSTTYAARSAGAPAHRKPRTMSVSKSTSSRPRTGLDRARLLLRTVQAGVVLGTRHRPWGLNAVLALTRDSNEITKGHQTETARVPLPHSVNDSLGQPPRTIAHAGRQESSEDLKLSTYTYMRSLRCGSCLSAVVASRLCHDQYVSGHA
jgi:hypothetical protein